MKNVKGKLVRQFSLKQHCCTNSEVCGGKNHEFPPYKVHNIIHNVPPCSACKLGHLVFGAQCQHAEAAMQQMLNLGSLKLFRDEMRKNFERENLSLEDMTQSPWHDLKRCLAMQWHSGPEIPLKYLLKMLARNRFFGQF